MTASKTFANIDTAKQERVLAAALEEFAEHGFQNASMNRLSADLGIAKGSIFKYFGSKEGLFRLVFTHGVELFARSLRRARAETSGQDFLARVRRSLREGMAFIEAHPLVYRLYLKMLFQERFPLREVFLAEVRQASARYFTPLVEDAKARGELRADLDTAAAVFVLDAALDRFLQARAVGYVDAGLGLKDAGPDELDARLEAVLDVLRRGLGA